MFDPSLFCVHNKKRTRKNTQRHLKRHKPLQSRTILTALIEFHFWYVPILVGGRRRIRINLIECAVDVHYLIFGYRTIAKKILSGCQFE